MSEFVQRRTQISYRGGPNNSKDPFLSMPSGQEFYTREDIMVITKLTTGEMSVVLKKQFDDIRLIHPFEIKIVHQIMNGFTRGDLENFIKLGLLLREGLQPVAAMRLFWASSLREEGPLSIAEILERSKDERRTIIGFPN